MTELIQQLKALPIIAAVRDRETLLAAVDSPVRVIFLLGGDPFNLEELVSLAREAGKPVFIHLDLVEGISRDAAGVRWIARAVRPTGVLSTRAALLRPASEEGLATVLRMFMVDSSSLETGERMVKTCAPDLVEVMPGLVTRAIAALRQRIEQHVIAGGMLELERDVRAALAAGALAASTSSKALWHHAAW